MIKQRLYGLALVAVGIICPVIMDGDATFSLFAVPYGLYFLFNRHNMIDIDE